MTGKLVDLDKARSLKQDEFNKRMQLLVEDLPLSFSEKHCAKVDAA